MEGPGGRAVGGAQKAGGAVGLSGSLLWLCVGAPPTQHMGLAGWEPHFPGNLVASGSMLCVENYGDILPGGRPKKLWLGFLLLWGHLLCFGLGELQTMVVGPCTPSSQWVVMVVETEGAWKMRFKGSPLCVGHGFFAFLGIRFLEMEETLGIIKFSLTIL